VAPSILVANPELGALSNFLRGGALDEGRGGVLNREASSWTRDGIDWCGARPVGREGLGSLWGREPFRAALRSLKSKTGADGRGILGGEVFEPVIGGAVSPFLTVARKTLPLCFRCVVRGRNLRRPGDLIPKNELCNLAECLLKGLPRGGQLSASPFRLEKLA
jgi:hypothetical protein